MSGRRWNGGRGALQADAVVAGGPRFSVNPIRGLALSHVAVVTPNDFP